MIISFKHKGLKKLYEKGDRSGIKPTMVARVEEVLTVLDAADKPEEANLPGYRLHPLTGDKKGFWSIKVTGNYRIIFGFDGEAFTKLDLIDYH